MYVLLHSPDCFDQSLRHLLENGILIFRATFDEIDLGKGQVTLRRFLRASSPSPFERPLTESANWHSRRKFNRRAIKVESSQACSRTSLG